MFVVHYATVNCLRLCTMQFKNYELCTVLKLFCHMILVTLLRVAADEFTKETCQE